MSRHIVLDESTNIKLDTVYALYSALEFSLNKLFDDSIISKVDE